MLLSNCTFLFGDARLYIKIQMLTYWIHNGQCYWWAGNLDQENKFRLQKNWTWNAKVKTAVSGYREFACSWCAREQEIMDDVNFRRNGVRCDGRQQRGSRWWAAARPGCATWPSRWQTRPAAAARATWRACPSSDARALHSAPLPFRTLKAAAGPLRRLSTHSFPSASLVPRNPASIEKPNQQSAKSKTHSVIANKYTVQIVS